MSSSRSRRINEGKGLASVSRSGQGDKDHTYLTVKLPANKLRQATSSRSGSSIAVNSDSAPKRPTRGNKKSYVVDDSDEDEDEDEDEGEDEIQVGAPAVVVDEDEDGAMDDADADVDADGEAVDDEMDIDAEGEDDEDAEGDDDVDVTSAQPAPLNKISKSLKTSPLTKKSKQATLKKGTGQSSAANADDSDDDDLSVLDSDDEAMNVGDEDAEGEDEDEDMDAEGEEIEEDQEAEGEQEVDIVAGPDPDILDSDDDGSRGETPDLSRMTQRQRARFEGLDESHYQALSNEVQAKKHFTVEEKAMRRAEMARRRRNLSEKRNEEVKQETINKLLKKQASKTNRKNLAAIGEEERDEDESKKANPIFIRWASSREGSYIAVPEQMMEGPAGRIFTNAVHPAPGTGLGGPRRMVEEIS